MFTPIHQLVHTLTFGDAISGEVLALRRCLHQLGFASEIYAINVDPRYKGLAQDYRNLDGNFSGQLILHYSLGSPLNQLYRQSKCSKRSLIYHNLTPAKWFEGVNPNIARHIRSGLEELPELCGITDLLLADSAFNAAELKELGYQAEVLDLPIDPERWNVTTNQGILDLLRADDSIHVLHVGRFAPNKRIEDIIKIFYFLRFFPETRCKLWLVGLDIDTELYSFGLKRLVRELDLVESVNFVGRMADTEVKAMYQASHIYLCMSEHEGFCLPLIEAMHFGLPVIAYDSSAVSGTVAAGGVLVKEKRYAQIAELIRKIMNEPELRAGLVQAGKRRAAEFTVDAFSKRVAELFGQGPTQQQVHPSRARA